MDQGIKISPSPPVGYVIGRVMGRAVFNQGSDVGGRDVRRNKRLRCHQPGNEWAEIGLPVL